MGLKLWAKMLPANQIAGFFKMEYCKKEVNCEVYVLYRDKRLIVTSHDQSTQIKFAVSPLKHGR